jgi:hypothetical protein
MIISLFIEFTEHEGRAGLATSESVSAVISLCRGSGCQG